MANIANVFIKYSGLPGLTMPLTMGRKLNLKHRRKLMNCPHCQQELPAEYSASHCFACGGSLPAAQSGSLDGEIKQLPIRFRTGWFFLFLLGPAVLTMISARLVGGTNESVSPHIALIGGGMGGIACGVMLGRLIPASIIMRILLCVVFSAVMVVVSTMLCSIGLNLGGYEPDLR